MLSAANNTLLLSFRIYIYISNTFITPPEKGSNVVRPPYPDRTGRRRPIAGEAPPLRPLLRPPRQGQPHPKSHQDILRRLSNPIHRPLRRRFRPLAQPPAPPPQIPRPGILDSGAGTRRRPRERRRGLQRDGAQRQPDHRGLLRLHAGGGLLPGADRRRFAGLVPVLSEGEEYDGDRRAAERRHPEGERRAVAAAGGGLGEGGGGFPVRYFVDDPVQDIGLA